MFEHLFLYFKDFCFALLLLTVVHAKIYLLKMALIIDQLWELMEKCILYGSWLEFYFSEIVCWHSWATILHLIFWLICSLKVDLRTCLNKPLTYIVACIPLLRADRTFGTLRKAWSCCRKEHNLDFLNWYQRSLLIEVILSTIYAKHDLTNVSRKHSF